MRILLALALLTAGLSLDPGTAPAAPLERVPEGIRPSRAVPDTVVPARRGDLLALETWQGSVTVRVTGEEELRVTGGGADRGVGVLRDGDALRVVARRPDASGDLFLEIPAWMAVRIHSLSLDVDMEGVAAPVEVQVLQGEFRLRDLSGGVRAHTLSGSVQAEGLSGDVSLTTLDGDIRVRGVRGRLVAEGTDGDLELEDVVGREVRGVTVDGEIRFAGDVPRGGTLTLATHDGDVTARLPAGTEAQVEVSTFDGSFESTFPVRAGGFQAGRPLRFPLGDGGGAQVVLQSFDGDIRLLSW